MRKGIYLLIIFILSCFILCNGVLVADDIFFYFIQDGIKPYKNFLYGTWVMEFQNLFLYYIPSLLNINFNDWALSFGTFFKASVITGIIYCFYKLGTLNKINNKIIIISCSIIYFLLFIFAKKIFFVDFIIYSGFFRFTFASLLLLIFFYYFYKFYIKKENKIFHLIFLAILISSSSEIAFFILLGTTFLALLHSLFEKSRNTKKTYLLSMIFFAVVTGTLILVNNNGFQNNISYKTLCHTTALEILTSSFIEYTKLFIKKFFIDFAIYYAILIILLILNIKKRNIESVILAIFINISTLVFAYCLIFLGKTHYSGGYWLNHNDIYTILIPLFIFNIVILLFNFIETENPKIQNYVFISLLIINFSLLPAFINSVQTLKHSNQNIKAHSYLRDKIRLFYVYRNEEPTVPNFGVLFSFFYLIQNKNIEFGQSDIEINKDNEKHTFHQWLENHYYKHTYKLENMNNENKDFILVSDKKALKTFKEKGGSYNEIYKGNYHFADLTNKNFVLNIDKNNLIQK